MKRVFSAILLTGIFAVMLGACAGGGSSRVYYHSHYGYGPWWGHRTYIDRRPIILPPDDRDAVNLPVHPDTGPPEFEATPLPAEPMMDNMDMGMPEPMDMDMGMDMD